MVLGVGVDIVKIKRIENAMSKHLNFINKLFNEKEIECLDIKKLKPEFVAGRFAAKEAVSKALGTGFKGFALKDIYVQKTKLGKPIVILKGEAEQLAKKHGNYKIHLSISHEIDNAIAFAIMEGDNSEYCNCRDNEKT